MTSMNKDLTKIIDWYWAYGCKRKDEFALPAGSWLNGIYEIAERSEVLSEMDMCEGARHALGVWGPSQSGKSTLLSHYLDTGRSEKNGSPCLTWDASCPTVFLHSQERSERTIVLNPYNRGSDASGCVTRYTLARQVKHPSHPVGIRFNREGHIMHSLACGYLSECRTELADGNVKLWDRTQVEEEFLAARLGKGEPPNRQAYERMRELLRIVGLFISSREPRYRNLFKGWDMLCQDILNDSAALRSVEEVERMAKRMLWDDVPQVSATYDRLRSLRRRLGWQDGKVFCTTQVASLLLDIDTFRRATKGDPNDGDAAIARAVSSLGFHEDAGEVLIGCGGGESAEISRRSFGDFQALVREIIIPVREPEGGADSKAGQFFRLLKVADLLDFPGVALQDSASSLAALINPEEVPVEDMRWLTTVFKRGKTASMVLGYAQDISIDAFAILVRAQTFPAKPGQLTSGIEHWWRCISPDYDPRNPPLGAKPPLPLSVCMTFFAKVINDSAIGSGTGLESVFGDMLGKLAPLTQPPNSHLFATTYKHLANGEGSFREGKQGIGSSIEFIKRDPSFRSAFSSEVSGESFDRMVEDADGGVGFFLEQPLAFINSSPRRAKLSDLEAEDRRRLSELFEEALPTGGDLGHAQKRVATKVARRLGGLHSGVGAEPSSRFMYPEHETVESLHSYLIRVMTHVDEADLEPIPKNFSTQKPETQEEYVKRQWVRWRESSLGRLRNLPGFDWGSLGLDGESEGLLLMRYISEPCAQDLFNFITDEMDGIQSDVVSRSLRRELAIAMGNLLRNGMINIPEPSQKDPNEFLSDLMRLPVAGLRRPNPHACCVTDVFVGRLEKYNPISGLRPEQPGDQQLTVIRSRF
jgi:hypothetical protein